MIIRIIISLIFLLLIGISTKSQFSITDISKIPVHYHQFLKPDVMGKVIIPDDLFEHHAFIKVSDTLTLFPYWPEEIEGANERGGVYSNLDTDPELEIIYCIGQKVYAFNLNTTSVPGWPVDVQLYPDGAPSVGDVDGDGFPEIVVTTHELGSFATGYVYALEINGTNVNGFPVQTEGGAVRTPVLADINNDGADEIIIAVRNWPDGFIHVYEGNGNMYPGWPVRMIDVPATTVAVGDINADGSPEIIGESYTALHAYDSNGTILPGFPFIPGENRVFSHSNPVLADLDDDGHREIIFGDHPSGDIDGRIYILKSDGTLFPGWPKSTSNWVYSPPSVGDVNGDGTLDIIVADYSSNITRVNKIYGWDSFSGEPLEGFPIDSVYGVFSQTLLTDLDGDQEIELIIDANIGPIGIYLAYNHDGTPLNDWPVYTTGSTFTINPFVADVNRDGILDISGGGYDQNTNKTNLYLWDSGHSLDPELNILPVLQYNTRHNGVYGDYLMVNVDESLFREEHEVFVYPNPSTSETKVYFSLNYPKKISISIHSTEGRLLSSLYDGKLSSGSHSLPLPLENLNPGLYIIKINFDFITSAVKVLVN